MENSMPLWMLVSALFPVFLFGTLIKAFLHFRRLRTGPEWDSGPSADRSRIGVEGIKGGFARSEDWVPSR